MDPIDLRPKNREEYPSPVALSNSSECPHVYLNGPKELADLPKEGLVTFEFKRSELTLTDGEEQPVRLVLKLKSIVDAQQGVEEDEEEEDSMEDDSGDALDKRFKKAAGEDEEVED